VCYKYNWPIVSFSNTCKYRVQPYFSMKRGLIFLSLLFFLGIHFSKAANSLPQSLDSTKINIKSLIAIWVSTDSTKLKIEFVNSKLHELHLKGFINFCFYFSINSSNFVYEEGVHIAWPPYSCKIKLVDETHLKVFFMQNYAYNNPPMLFRKLN